MYPTDILTSRRDAAEAYMRKITEPVWRAGEDITCSQETGVSSDAAKKPLRCKKGSSLHPDCLTAYGCIQFIQNERKRKL